MVFTIERLDRVETFKTSVNFEINRCYYLYDIKDAMNFYYLYGFSGSFLIVYRFCAYIKCSTRARKVFISLVSSKSRSVPVKKKLTIPELELLGSYILSNLMGKIYTAFSEKITIKIIFVEVTLRFR